MGDWSYYQWSKNVKKEDDESLVSRITSLIDSMTKPKSEITVMDVGKDSNDIGYRATQVYLSGGLNGRGTWSEYLADLSEILKAVENDFRGEAERVVLSDMYMDLCDDIFYPTVNIVWSYEREP